jgi:general secretion pathway protein G
MCRLERFHPTSTARKLVMQPRCHSAVRPRSHRRSRSAFTLLELLIVLAIIGVIAAMVVPRFLSQQQGANVKLSRTAIMNLEKAIEMYAVEHDGEPPTGTQDTALPLLLKPLDKDGKAMKPFVDKIPKDAWDQPLFYEYPNTKDPDTDRPAIWSSGQNRQNENGEGDDINNWKDLAK